MVNYLHAFELLLEVGHQRFAGGVAVEVKVYDCRPALPEGGKGAVLHGGGVENDHRSMPMDGVGGEGGQEIEKSLEQCYWLGAVEFQAVQFDAGDVLLACDALVIGVAQFKAFADVGKAQRKIGFALLGEVDFF